MHLLNVIYIYGCTYQERLDELHRLWALLLARLADKGTKLQQALKLVQFMRECREVMFWINDKVKICKLLKIIVQFLM